MLRVILSGCSFVPSVLYGSITETNVEYVRDVFSLNMNIDKEMRLRVLPDLFEDVTDKTLMSGRFEYNTISAGTRNKFGNFTLLGHAVRSRFGIAQLQQLEPWSIPCNFAAADDLIVDYLWGCKVRSEPPSVTSIKYLLEKGARLNDRGFQGQTPLMFAVEWFDPSTVNWLIDAGANVNSVDMFGFSCLDRCMVLQPNVRSSMREVLLLAGAFVQAVADKPYPATP